MKLIISLTRIQVKRPIISEIVKETGILINVERAQVDSTEGELLIDVPDDDAQQVIDILKSYGAVVEKLEDAVTRDEIECIDCGACISICPQNVFSFDDEWKLVLDQDSCILCGKCVSACPQNALSIHR